MFSAIFLRLGYLQLIAGKDMQALAASQWLRDLPLSAKRGDILDCNGVLLATTETTYDIYVRARNVTQPNEVAKLLANTLDLNFDKTYTKVTNK
ncbi:MAG: stage V sporulation protein D, partial [Clostridia bacterium]|nr:stage V sporulation protein D [Clostridia bacterium]